MRAACIASETVQDPDFIARLQIPMLFVAAGTDAVVSTPAIEHYVRQIKSASLLTIDGARHEIWQEADIYREQLLAAFDAFVPGSGSGDSVSNATASGLRLLFAVQNFHRRLVQLRASRRRAMSPPCSAGFPSKVVTTPPAFSMIGISADNVVGLQPGIDDDVGMAGGHHRKGVAVGAVARQPHRASSRSKARRAPLNNAGVVVNSVASASRVVLRVAQRCAARRAPRNAQPISVA